MTGVIFYKTILEGLVDDEYEMQVRVVLKEGAQYSRGSRKIQVQVGMELFQLSRSKVTFPMKLAIASFTELQDTLNRLIKLVLIVNHPVERAEGRHF